MFNFKVSSLPKPKDQELQDIYNIIKQNNSVQADIGNKTPQLKSANETQQKLQDFIDKYSKDEGSIKERLATFRCSADNCDTLLHAAVTYDAGIEFINFVLQHCPNLINTTRQGSYEGQNVLHIAIAKGDIELTKVILEASENKEKLLTALAKGSKFKKTVVMGETPLSVAVLTLRTEMIDLLLEHGARIDQVNSKGDNVIHTLIKLAKLKREKLPDIIDILKYFGETKFQIHNANETKDTSDVAITSVDGKDSVAKQQPEHCDKGEDIVHRIWFKENRDLITPLQLATVLGLHEIFKVMMKMENVFYYPGNFDGANYAHFYDITEIDHIAQSKCTKLRKEKADDFGLIFSIISLFFPKRPICVIESLCSMKWNDVKPFHEMEILTTIIKRRWKRYRLPFFVFGIVHLFVLILFSTSSLCRVRVLYSTCDYCSYEKLYGKVVTCILPLYSLFIAFTEIYRWFRLKDMLFMFWADHIDGYNLLYRLSLWLFAFFLVFDFFISIFSAFDNFIFLAALFSGSFFCLFFFKGFERLSFFSVLFIEAIGSLFSFGFIISIAYATFTFAMFIVLEGQGQIDEFSGFGNTTLTMFSFMLGIKELTFLNEVDRVNRVYVAVIYVCFVFITYIYLINSLIALMSGACGDVFKDRKSVAILQKSSVIIFLDGLLLKRRLLQENIGYTRLRENRAYISIETEVADDRKD